MLSLLNVLVLKRGEEGTAAAIHWDSLSLEFRSLLLFFQPRLAQVTILGTLKLGAGCLVPLELSSSPGLWAPASLHRD